MVGFDPITDETPIDPSGLTDKRIKTRAALNRAEAKNILKAYKKYLSKKPASNLVTFEFEWLLQLHFEMFGGVWNYAGQLRTINLNIGRVNHLIANDLAELLDNLKWWQDHNSFSIVERAARIHHQAVFIHPFLGGNGRWARLLANIYLRINNSRIVAWPEIGITDGTSSVRGRYIDCLKIADKGDYRSLVLLHEEFLESSV